MSIIFANNGTIVNGTAFFVQDTKPTTRTGGSALVVGDRWYKSDDGTEWFWNGTYWLSGTEYILCTSFANNLSVTTNLGLILNPSPVITSSSNTANQLNAFVTRCLFHSRDMATNDASNYWTCVLAAQNGFGTGVNISPTINTVDTISATSHGNNGRRKETSLNQLLTAIPYNVTSTITKVGSPSNLTGHFIYLYRTVYI